MVYIIIMVVCFILSAYFSSTETAFVSLNKTRMKAYAEKGNKRAELALNLVDNYDRLISTILIGNNIVNILTSSVGTLFFVDLLNDQEDGATLATVVVTIVVLIVGEITPKTVAKQYPERFAMLSAPIARFFLILFTPVNWIFSLWQNFVTKVFKKNDEEEKTSSEELIIMVDEVEKEGSIDEDEGDLLRNAIEFNDRLAEEILTHRVDVEALPLDSTKEEIAKTFTATRFSRLLMYEDSIDKIVGVIHQKDFYVNGGMYPGDIKEIVATPTFIHQTEKISNLLKILQQEKSHIAVVLDEYGGTLGIVTMEDILEELVGEIWDEHDEVVEDYLEAGENTWNVDASVNLEDFADKFEIDVEEAESVSLGGWVAEQLGKVPEEGDFFEYENLSITVLACEDHRVNSVTVVINEPDDEDEDDKEEKKNRSEE